MTHESKGAVVIGDDGTILWSGPLSLLPRDFAGAPTDDYGDCIVMPGFIDAHIHFPQYRMLAAPGKDLLDWLDRFTFPEESALFRLSTMPTANAEIFLQSSVCKWHDDGHGLLLGAQAPVPMRCSAKRSRAGMALGHRQDDDGPQCAACGA